MIRLTLRDRVTKQIRGTIKIGRNDKCLCGSGKKFKKCCMSRYSVKGEQR